MTTLLALLFLAGLGALVLGGILTSAAKRCPKCDRHSDGEGCVCETERKQP